MCDDKKINVLMITGVYLPEINGAVRQCSILINNLRELVNYAILTGTNDESSEGVDCVEGVLVNRIFFPKRRKLKYFINIVKFFICLIRELKIVDLVHIHGFSKRNSIVILISWFLGKKIVIKMTSFGHDDPLSIKKNYNYFFWGMFKCCNAYIGVSPAFFISYYASKLAEHKYNFIPNGVDLKKYSPVSINIKKVLRKKYGFSEHDKLILFIGHFSLEKRPMLLYRAWAKLYEMGIFTNLILIGRTKNDFEVDERIFESIKLEALQREIFQFIHFVENTRYVDEYMKIADVFVLPSLREGLPNVLLEAMACAVPCVVSNLPGVTDWLVNDGESGKLFHSDDSDELAVMIAPYLLEYDARQKMGIAARQVIKSNFSSASTSQKVFDLYRKIMR